MTRIYFLTLVAAMVLIGCSNQPQESDFAGQSGIAAGRLAPYQHTLAAQLFEKQQGLQRVAIASFVPADSLSQDQSKHTLLAKQLQEGVMTAANSYNVSVIEYRLTQQLQLGQQQERALSRNPSELRENYRFDYIVVGTYSEVEGGLLMNTRLVNTRSAAVLSAASVMVPWHTIESMPTSSQWRRGGLYRESVNEG
ncbi:FlgO family outer membrane protein [Aliidiomarina quisquiliarum]|uniref:FlgO family outer membrane protein n=1 Tax=Aliidiomarina quisquiliarum TaxID=2938947 RepID=UPI00208F0C1B|nr:FlgO family outer membrane protein [Aliidiomarina quisquiliarum]MCO4321226.1 FlgO family outer membrane protein [Aliidiomarina quisquiliarum]